MSVVQKATTVALVVMASSAGLIAAPHDALGRAAKVQQTAPVAEPPVKRADDPGCRTCLSEAASKFARGQTKEASAQLSEFTDKCPNSTQFHLLYSTVLMRTGSMALAEQEAAKAAEANPSSLAAHLQRGLALTALEKKMEAAKAFERAVEIDPTCYEAWVSLSSIYRQLHEDEKATDATAKAADLEPGSKSLRMGTLMNLKRAGKLSEARAEITRLLALPNTSPEFAEELARESMLVGGYDEAAAASGKALVAHPKAVAPLMTSALAHLCRNNFTACIEDASKVLALEPSNVDAIAIKAMALVKSNKVDEAESALKDAAGETNSAMYWLTKGSIDAARNNLPGAENDLLSCLSYDQGNNAMQGIPHAFARIKLAEVYKQQKKTALVQEQMQALARDKRFAKAIQDLQN